MTVITGLLERITVLLSVMTVIIQKLLSLLEVINESAVITPSNFENNGNYCLLSNYCSNYSKLVWKNYHKHDYYAKKSNRNVFTGQESVYRNKYRNYCQEQ